MFLADFLSPDPPRYFSDDGGREKGSVDSLSQGFYPPPQFHKSLVTKRSHQDLLPEPQHISALPSSNSKTANKYRSL